MESNLIKLDTQLAEYVAMHFYKKGYEDGQNEKVKYSREKKIHKMVVDCLEEYKIYSAEELRKDNPHHHTNRLD